MVEFRFLGKKPPFKVRTVSAFGYSAERKTLHHFEACYAGKDVELALLQAHKQGLETILLRKLEALRERDKRLADALDWKPRTKKQKENEAKIRLLLMRSAVKELRGEK